MLEGKEPNAPCEKRSGQGLTKNRRWLNRLTWLLTFQIPKRSIMQFSVVASYDIRITLTQNV